MTTAQKIPQKIRGLFAPGGFANAVGIHLSALDEGLAEIRAGAAALPAAVWHRAGPGDVGTPAAHLLHIAEVEARWIHEGIGGRPHVPVGVPATAPLDKILAHLDAVRATTAAILKPLVEADLDRLRAAPDCEGKAAGKTTIRRILVDALEHQAYQWGRASMLARVLVAPPRA